MAIKRGESKNIIVGAASFFVADEALDFFTAADVSAAGGSPAASGVYLVSSVSSTPKPIPTPTASLSYADTLDGDADWRNVGFTMNGIEIQFQPDFGEVTVDQVLDVAKLYKQGMQVNLNTAFAEATLENLLVAIAGGASDKTTTGTYNTTLNLSAGDIGSCPVERALIAVGPGTGDCTVGGTANNTERIYVAHRALSIDNVTVSAKRDEPSMFEVSFRLLPASNGSYGKIVDRVLKSAAL